MKPQTLLISAGSLQELLVVAHDRGCLEPLDALWERLDLDGMTVDVECARRAVGVVQRLGKGQARRAPTYSHSIVPGGLLVMSYTTRFTPLTSLTMRVEICSNRS